MIYRVPQNDSSIIENSTEVSVIQNQKRSLDCTTGRPDDDKRKKQVIQGRIARLADKQVNILIVAEFWPSVLLGYNLPTSDSNVWVVCGVIPDTLQTVMPGVVHWVTTEDVKKNYLVEKCEWIVVQGSMKFVAGSLSSWCKLTLSSNCKLLVVTPAKRFRLETGFLKNIKCWKNIAHSTLGGVTTSKWRVGVWDKGYTWKASDLHQFCQAYGLARKFGDVISHVEVGKSVEKSHTSLPVLIPWYKDSFARLFVLPSIFSSTNFVLRKLVLKEVAGIFDLSELVLDKLIENGLKSVDQMLDMFSLDIPPMKVAHLSMNIVRSTPTGPLSVMLDDGESTKLDSVNGTPFSDLLLLQPGTLAVADSTQDYVIQYGQKAGKNDDAGIPVMLWNRYIFAHHLRHISFDPLKHVRILDCIRKGCLRRYRLNIRRSFIRYLCKEYGNDWMTKLIDTRAHLTSRKRKRRGEVYTSHLLSSQSYRNLRRDLEVGRDCLRRSCNASYWEWLDGSTCYFWRWPLGIRQGVRDGVPIFIQGRLPKWRKKQALPSKAYMVDKMREKLGKVVDRRYLVDGAVVSLINCFSVEKGHDDIRLVYDGTKSGLNDCVFAPNFYMPSIDSMLMTVDLNSWFGDNDLGEMFLNYCLHDTIQKYSGVDLTAILGSAKTNWKTWNRMFMGFCPSPYVAVKLFGWCIDMIMGDRWDDNNPFRWDSVSSNLPGSQHYDPSKPRMYKTWLGLIAAVIEAYVDDIRSIGNSELNCKQAGSQASKILQYLGQQDAARKYRPPHKRPGPWCGTFVAIQDDCVWVYVSEEKWNKAKTFINLVAKLIEEGRDLDHEMLEKGRGFMVYFCRTYTSLTPFLKGINLTLDSWRKGRDDDGWKNKTLTDKSLGSLETDDGLDFDLDECNDDLLIVNELSGDETYLSCGSKGRYKRGETAPKTVRAVPRLCDDIAALQLFLRNENAPWRFVRGKRVAVVHYGFGDASKSGFGATIQDANLNLWYRLGVWSCNEEDESSNYRELANLVEALEDRLTSTDSSGTELYIFTDNSTAEAAFYKGTSSSKKLFQLVLRLKMLEVERRCIINIIHVAGTRMIQQGTDGLSRGDFSTGVMQGQSILSFVPIHLSCLERSTKLKEWIVSMVPPAAGEEEIIFLDSSGWFERGHDIIGGCKNDDGIWTPKYKSGTYVWTPPPAAALVAVEQLRRARHKREDSTHIFLVPRLMTPEWQRQLHRVSDLFVELPYDDSLWNKSIQHEPLIFAVIFPFLNYRPWQLKRTGAFLGMGRILRSMWKSDEVPSWFVLRKLFEQQRKLSDLQEGVVRKMLCGPGQFGFLHTSGGE